MKRFITDQGFSVRFFTSKGVVRFLSYSVLLHLLVVFAVGQNGSFSHGLDGRKTGTAVAGTVFATIASASSASSERATPASADPAISRNGGRHSGMHPRSVSSAGDERLDFVRESGKGMPEREGEIGKGDNAGQRYFVAGKLTRLPAPLAPVDLNVPAITQRSAGRPIEITLLIDSNGAVASVLRANRDEETREFFELVAMQFKKVRFTPGEIDGKRVNAQLTIAVISEPA